MAKKKGIAEYFDTLADNKTMKYPFKVGDHIQWNSEAGFVTGIITKIHFSNFNYKGYIHHASQEDPQYAIQSDKTNHIAVHKGKVLTKLSS